MADNPKLKVSPSVSQSLLMIQVLIFYPTSIDEDGDFVLAEKKQFKALLYHDVM